MSKERSTDRVLVLGQIDGEKPLSSSGLVDVRLFSGENKLHAIKDKESNLWSVKYEQGAVPPALKDSRWTSFEHLYKAAETYFKKRNIQITEVID